ncbi:MAG: hypothetical protein IJ519_05245, partial [Clostridia bacterium]|nr:hypothetical protein [Clostridia bacterium]
CANCDNCADFDGVLCERCYRVAYCLYCDEPADRVSEDSPGLSYGICDECYVPCKECENHGNESLDGYCGSCYLKSFCYHCQGEPTNLVEADGYTFAFCDECYARYLNNDIAI